ncbi:Na+/H+ antiporter NhaA [Paraflavitalea soli]|uniref:Na(+)/H(+) antiporter NhaA n=1 Tax=Paraflavitalea soli TaxID=2315862 RepID=A0A3B7MX38_9BACT|nr:Na+/H+ antiporter NhaA [Paraflavitalea soli]AXY77630.1 Na+/H+ antiporter NhaA [Paraflavitalea soli]
MAIKINVHLFKRFVSAGSIGGIILLCAVLLSLLVANSPWAGWFSQLINKELGINTAYIHLKFSILHWINDGLMALFFLYVGLEIKRAFVEGELSTFKRASLPVFAAIGGAITPALIFYIINATTDTEHGWGIPMATDIAFAIGVLSLLGDKVPPSLKIFLAALAIADDLIAVLVIAVFYSINLQLNFLSYAAGCFLVMIICNRLGVKKLALYLIPGAFMWYFIHHSGVHATIAGVLTAIAIPTNKVAQESPLERLEHLLSKPVNFAIMPLFAIVNTNISIEPGMLDGLIDKPGLGIITGLLLGKPLGITLTAWIIVKLGWGELPRGAGWGHMLGLGLLGGIGFTMSIFIALLSFDDPLISTGSKFSILIASTIAGILGLLVLNSVGRQTRLIKIPR